MFSKILIANRGEIAVRIIRACRELGIKSVAVFSDVDRDALHVLLADDAVCIGPAPIKLSYLNIPAILAAAEVSGADAIHPGYGFLSEDDDFAEKCRTSQIEFIGPSHDIIRMMGDKIEGRKIAESAGVPTIPGTKNAITELSEALTFSEKIGFPLMIKAKDGGGGRGMRIVRAKAGFNKAFELAKAESESAFSSPYLFIERYLENPRHVEVQLLGDQHGNIIHLGERDCSMQRRHQKIIEEAPAPFLPQKLREKIHESAIKLARKVKYFSAGTIEFLVDSKMNHYFIEMNTRLQVEHPVSEMITGIDIVKEQILIAAGEKMTLKQKDVEVRGHSIECRITAENPTNLQPSPGTISKYFAPGGYGVRVDSGVYQGSKVLPFYDSMFAKLITYGSNREEARIRMLRALDEYRIEGISTIIPLHTRILKSLQFIEGHLSTNLISDFMNQDHSKII